MLVVPSSLSGDSRTCAGAPGTCWDGCMAADYFWNASAQWFLIHFLFQVLSVYLQCIPCTPGRHSCFLWGMVPCMLRGVGTFFIFTLLLAIPCSALRFSIIEDCVNPLEGGLDESGRSVYSMFHQYILRPVVHRLVVVYTRQLFMRLPCTTRFAGTTADGQKRGVPGILECPFFFLLCARHFNEAVLYKQA
jgi:hypothetical protein